MTTRCKTSMNYVLNSRLETLRTKFEILEMHIRHCISSANECSIFVHDILLQILDNLNSHRWCGLVV